jgi:predicted XRE-type DNA-binding protein
MTKGSQNLFADLGFKNPELEMTKSRFVTEMAAVIEDRKISRAEAARIAGWPQPEFARLLKGHWRQYRIEKLARCLNKLGVTVRLTLERNTGTWETGHLIVAERQ